MSKLDDFLFCAKYCILQNSTVLSSNMAKVFFFKFQLKIPKQGILGLKFDFFLFWKKLCSRTNCRVLISNMKVFFKVEAQWIFCPKFLDFYFCRKLCFDKFESPDFKYGNRFSKLQPKNTPARLFRSQTWKLFALHKTLTFEIFESAGVKQDSTVFKFQVKKPK